MIQEQDFRNTRFEIKVFSKSKNFDSSLGDSRKTIQIFEKIKPKVTFEDGYLQNKSL